MRTKYVTDWDTVPVLVDAAMVAIIMGVNVQQVYRWAETGALPSVKIGSTVRFRKSDLMEVPK